ncbi:MAG: ribonuclease H-like domain-containing protein, partial [Gammaproteobacteria bacterium]
LVRSDVLARLFPGSMEPAEAARPAPGLDGRPWHYRVVDVKFTTLDLLAGGDLGNGGSQPAYKIQLFLYDRALARIQGTGRTTSYLLGRGWRRPCEGETDRGANAFERLGPFPPDGTLANGAEPERVAGEACAWIRRVRRKGAGWNILPEPSCHELWPNLTNREDSPWHATRWRIAEKLEDPTLLWQVGVPCRETARRHGVTSWRDARCTPELLGVKEAYRPTLAAILEVNRSADGPPVRPVRVRAAEEEWRAAPRIGFYVDFETVNDLWDDFTRFPDRSVPPLIFLIGCGHMEEGEWRFERFLAEELTEEAEARVIDAWLAYMEAVRARLDSDGSPLIIHWSGAEPINFETAYNSACRRHPDRTWPRPRWFDLLQRVFHAEPVIVRGAFGFGLKEIARALHSNGLIKTLWEDSSLDGLGAMTGAWWSYEEAGRRKVAAQEIDLMREILRYNEVDCKSLNDVVDWLRQGTVCAYQLA